MPNINYTDITAILDRSGSMITVKKDTEGGFDHFIAEQRKVPGKATFTLVQFDTVYEFVYKGVTLDEVKPLVLEPRGNTALLDAIGRAINETGTRLAAMPEPERPAKVLVVIITDGAENASKEFDIAKIKEMITRQTNDYQWTFVFIGADQDAIQAGANIGVAVSNSLSYTNNAVGTCALYNTLSNKTAALRVGSAVATAMFFDATDQKLQDDAKQPTQNK